MQPNTEPEANVTPPANAAPLALTSEFEELLRRVLSCTRDEKRAILDRVLRDLIGDKPEQEYGLYNPDGTSYICLVPPKIRRALAQTPEFLAELDRSSRCTETTPFSDLIARLESMP